MATSPPSPTTTQTLLLYQLFPHHIRYFYHTGQSGVNSP